MEHKDIDFLNLNDLSSGPPTVPKAEYHLKIVEAEFKQNQAKDGYYVRYRTVIQSGEHAGDSVYSMWSLKEKWIWKMNKDFKAMGYAPAGGKPSVKDLIGFEGIAAVSEKPKKDDPKTKENSIDRWIGPIA